MKTRVSSRSLVASLSLAVVLALGVPLVAQQAVAPPRALTADDYARAERFLGYNANPLMFRATVRPRWLADDRFWYRVTVPGGAEFILVDPARATREPAFDHARIATTLSASAKSTYTATTLPFSEFDFSADNQSIEFTAAKRRWRCDREGAACTVIDSAPGASQPTSRDSGSAPSARGQVLSPDGARAAFVREHNLWVREVASGRETQLTTDGIKDFAYATNDAGWTRSDTPVVVWSPDSKKIATFRHDSRGVGEMYFVNTVVGHPTLTAIKYPLPGDDKIFMIERVIIDVDQKKVVNV